MLHTLKGIVLSWFVFSIVLELVTGFILETWLRQQGAKLNFFLLAIPGYLDGEYMKWCRSHGRSHRFVYFGRKALLGNAITASAVTVLVLALRR
jgi:hypothetical protein